MKKIQNSEKLTRFNPMPLPLNSSINSKIKKNSKSFKVESHNPSLFLKKIKRSLASDTKKISLNSLGDFYGITKYFPPMSLEWINSLYNYNKNYDKLITVADKNMTSLSKSYLNLKFSRKQKEKKIVRANKQGLTLSLYRTNRRRVSLRKRLSLNRVYLSNGGVKHTSNKAIVTLFFYKKIKNYVRYNTLVKLMYLHYKKIQRTIKRFPHKKNFLPKLSILADKKLQSFKAAQLDRINRNRHIKKKFLLRKKLRNQWEKEQEKKLKYRDRQMHRKAFYWKRDLSIFWKSILNITMFSNQERVIWYSKFINYKIKAHRPIYKSDNDTPLLKTLESKMHYYVFKGGELATLRSEFSKFRTNILTYNIHIRYFLLNELKFKNKFLENFRRIASKIYNKNVFFNFVKLKKYHYNSNIYSQIIAIRLRKREHNISNILRKSLANVKLAKLPKRPWDEVLEQNILIARSLLRQNILAEKNILNLLIVRPKLLKQLKNKHNNYWFQCLLFKYHRISNPFSIFGRARLSQAKRIFKSMFPNKTWKKTLAYNRLKFFTRRFNLKIKFVKNQVIAGLRVEVNGRLTKRFKAARPLYKLKWIGGTRNVEASYLKLPVALTRGHVLSNVESSVLSSHRRIGAYAVKATVSSANAKY